MGVVTCRPTAREAQEYYRHAVVDNADWAAVDNILRMKNITPHTHSPEEFQRIRDHQANGMGGLPLVGDPDAVAQDMAQLAVLGLRGIAVSFVNYLEELPYFCVREFASDSPLEESGFEPLVPLNLRRRHFSVSKRMSLARRR